MAVIEWVLCQPAGGYRPGVRSCYVSTIVPVRGVRSRPRLRRTHTCCCFWSDPGADPRAWPGWVRRRVEGSSENDASSSATRKSLLLTSKSKMLTRKSLLLTSKSEMLTRKSLLLTSKSEMLTRKSLFLTSKSKMLTRKSLFLTSKSKMLARKSLLLTSKSEMLTRKSLFLTSKSKMLGRKSLFLIADVEPRKCFYRPRSNARPASGLIDPTGKIVVSVIGDEVSGVLCKCRFRVWDQAHRQHGPPNCGRNGSGGFGPAGDP